MKSQLVEARRNIAEQLMQLEGSAIDPYDGGIGLGMMPDNRKVYADLQRELHEMDAMLEADGKDADVEAKSAYQPMVKWYGDGTVGNPVRPTLPGIIIGIVSIALLVLTLGVAVLRTLAQ